MLIDPFTVLAQIVNFAILAFALKRLLYGRVIEAIDRREASIAARLEEAEEREAAAEAEEARYREERERLAHRRRELLDEARTEATDHRQRLLDEARAEVDEERRRWNRALEADREADARLVQRRTADEIVRLSREILAELASVELEEAVIDRGLDQMAARTDVADDLLGLDDGRPLTVRTAFAVPGDRRREVADRLRSIGLHPSRAVHFVHDPGLVLGVEFHGDGTSVGWNAGDYLDRFGDEVEGLDGSGIDGR